jgi:hypothetical protein
VAPPFKLLPSYALGGSPGFPNRRMIPSTSRLSRSGRREICRVASRTAPSCNASTSR